MSALLNAVAPILAHGQTTRKLPLEELVKAPFQEYLAGTMKSAPGIFLASPDDRRELLDAFDEATERRETADVFRSVFQQARETVVVERDRDVLLWCQTLIESLLGLAITANEGEIEIEPEKKGKPATRGIPAAVSTKKYKSKKQQRRQYEEEDEDSYEQSEDEDGSYEPSEDEYEDDDEEYDDEVDDSLSDEGDKVTSPKKSPQRKAAATDKKPQGKAAATEKTPRRKAAANKASETKTKTKTSATGKSSRSKASATDSKDDSSSSARPAARGGRRRKEIVITDEALEIAKAVYAKPNLSQGGYYCSGHFFPTEEAYVALIATLQQVKKTLDVCVFTLTDDHLANLMIGAHKRGVQIRIITDDLQAKCLGADAFRLRDDYGIPVITDHGAAFMHNKFAIIDSRVLITGSYNWTVAAHYNNNENIVIMNHLPTIKSFKQEFERLWELFHEEERQGKGKGKEEEEKKKK